MRLIDADKVIEFAEIWEKEYENRCLTADNIIHMVNRFPSVDVADIRAKAFKEMEKASDVTIRSLAFNVIEKQCNYPEDTKCYFSKGIIEYVDYLENFIKDYLMRMQNDN